jgi:hypothetical protein
LFAKKRKKLAKSQKFAIFTAFLPLKNCLINESDKVNLIDSATEPQASARGLLNCLAVAVSATLSDLSYASEMSDQFRPIRKPPYCLAPPPMGGVLKFV